MDVETLLRQTLAQQAADAPRAGGDFFAVAVQGRSARRRKLGGTGLAVAAVALVVGVTVGTAASGGPGGAASPAAGAAEAGGPDAAGPAPSAEEQQAELAADLGIQDPPAVDVVRLVTPIQRERLVDVCLADRGWGESVVRETTTVDVATGELSTGSTGGGFSFPVEQQPAFDLATYTCMASYPIDPAYVEDSDDAYVRSAPVEAAGRGEGLPGYAFGPPSEVEPDIGPGTSVSWVDDGELFAVTTGGSSSCPFVPVRWTVDHGTLAVETGPLRPDQETCNEDYGPYTVVLEVPAGIDAAQDVAVTLDGSPVTLPGIR